MIRWALCARIIITCTYLLIVMALFVMFGMPIFGKPMRLSSNITDSHRILAIQTYYIYDVTKTPQYELTFLSQFIASFIAATVYTAIDNFLGFLVLHICGQLDIMSNRLKNSHENFYVILRNNVMHSFAQVHVHSAIHTYCTYMMKYLIYWKCCVVGL